MHIEFKFDPGANNTRYITFVVNEIEVRDQVWEEIPLFEFLRLKQDLWFKYTPQNSLRTQDLDDIDYLHSSQETEIVDVLAHLFPDRKADLEHSRLAYVECFE